MSAIPITLEEFEAGMYGAVETFKDAMTACTREFEASIDSFHKRSEGLSPAAVHGILLEVKRRMDEFGEKV